MNDVKTQPLFRVACARIIGKDRYGKDQLGSIREIGVVWPRRNGKPGGILKFDIVPAEIANHEAVIFLQAVENNPEIEIED